MSEHKHHPKHHRLQSKHHVVHIKNGGVDHDPLYVNNGDTVAWHGDDGAYEIDFAGSKPIPNAKIHVPKGQDSKPETVSAPKNSYNYDVASADASCAMDPVIIVQN